jgi:hypothetical protein
LLIPETNQSLKNSRDRAGVLECHTRYGPMLEIGKPLHIRLAFTLMTFLKLSGEPLLDGVRPCPRCNMLPVDLVPDLYIGQGSKCGLDFIQKVVRIAGGLCQRCKRFLRGRAMGHGCSPLSGRQQP